MDNHSQAVEEEIRKVEGDIQAAAVELAKATDEDGKDYWRKKEGSLCKKKEQLSEEKLIAMRAGAATGLGSAAAAGGGGGGGAGGLATATGAAADLLSATADLTSVLAGLKSLLPAISLLCELQMTQFEYSASKASSSRQGDDFKARLQTFYCNTADAQHQLRCMLLNVKLPMTLVTGAHLFKYCWKAQLHILIGLKDINNAGNGLLLFKPLKHAFDDSRICFTYVVEAGEPKFKLKLLDPALEAVKLWDYAETHDLRKKYDEDQIDSYAATVTFGELQGKALVFQNDNRPCRRCLRFQMMQALRRAKTNGWLPADWTPSEDLTYNSEDGKERMDAWLSLAAQAPPPPPDSDSSADE